MLHIPQKKRGNFPSFCFFILPFLFYLFLTSKVPPIMANKNKTRNMKNRILAIEAAPAAMPVKPNKAATKATTKNINDHLNIISEF